MISKPCPTRPDLLATLKRAAAAPPMTPAERQEQRISFAYGNVSLSNPRITRDQVRAADHAIHGNLQEEQHD